MRESGYYWVRIGKDRDWRIMECAGGDWWLMFGDVTGDCFELSQGDAEIDERRIVREPEPD